MEPYELSTSPTEVLIHRLKSSPEENVRIAIMIELVMRNEIIAINTLIEMLDEDGDLVKMTAIWALGEFGAPQAVESLLKLVQPETVFEDTSYAIIDALRKIGDPAVKPLFLYLEVPDTNEDICTFIGETIASINTTYSFESTLEYATHPNPNIRLGATIALSYFRHPDTIPTLLHLAQDPHSYVCYEALQALDFPYHQEHFRDFLLDCLDSDDEMIVAEAVNALVRNECRQDIDRIFALIDHRAPVVIQSVLHAIVIFEATALIPKIKGLLSHPSEETREWAAIAIGDLKVDEMREFLLQCIQLENNPSVLNEIVISLGSIGNKAVYDRLRAKRKSFPPNVQIERALLKLGDAKAHKYFLQKIRSHIIEDRLEAIWAFGDAKDMKSVPPLVGALVDSDWSVRSEATQALGRIKAQSSIKALAEALKKDEIAFVREAAAIALGDIGFLEGIRPLVQALQYDDDPTVRAAAAFSLGRIGDQQVQKPLSIALLDMNENVRAAAAEAMANLKDPSLSKRLRQLLNDEFVTPRAAALNAIAQLEQQN